MSQGSPETGSFGEQLNVVLNLALLERYSLNSGCRLCGRRSEVRGKLGYETDGYDPNDKLHQLLDKVGRSASVSDMMNGDVVHINPRHPQGPSAKKAASAITSEKIQEAFDNPYPITWEYLKPTGASSAIAKLDDGSALDIHISEDPAGIYEIEFARGSSKKNMGRSGQGDDFRIFAT